MKTSVFISTAAVITIAFVIGCSDFPESPITDCDREDVELRELLAKPFFMNDAVPPSPLETVVFGGEPLTFWPFTGNDFSGQGHDPVNLIFFGEADPLDIRAALLALDGNRPGALPMPPFNSCWDDAIGDVQVSYGDGEGWTGGVIQLACGDYGPLRFHLRLFKVGDWTLGNAHFEMLIPGTTDHQVLSWELAEQFVIGDLIRSGLLDDAAPMAPTQQINSSPWRTIPSVIYNELPVELRALIEGPLGDVTDDVPIKNDGHAVILNLADTESRVAETRNQDMIIEFGQVIPKPFCSAGPSDYVYVQGPVHLVQTSSLEETGEYHVTFRADGQLAVTPINPMTGEPIGETLTAEIVEHHDGHYTDRIQWASSMMSQHLLPDTAEGAGRLFVRLRIRSQGGSGYRADIRCADNPWEPVSEWNLPPTMQEPTVAPGAGMDVRF